MPTLPEVIVTMLLPFEHLFDPRTWRKAQLLVVGAILSPGKRTVSSALNILGVGQHGDFALYHQVLNRARWSPLQLSRVLLLLVAGRLGSSNEPLVFGIDETVERRWGRKIAAKGRYRDAVRSTDDQVVMTPGLQWVSRIGWAGRHWALPFLTALATSARYDRRKGRRHKMVTDYAQQMLVCLRRWLPERDLVVVCDGGYAKREFLLHCQSMSKPIVVITKLRKDASLYQPAPPRRPGQIGRPRVVGARLPSPTAVLDDPATQWTPGRATGSDGSVAMGRRAVSKNAPPLGGEGRCASICWRSDPENQSVYAGGSGATGLIGCGCCRGSVPFGAFPGPVRAGRSRLPSSTTPGFPRCGRQWTPGTRWQCPRTLW